MGTILSLQPNIMWARACVHASERLSHCFACTCCSPSQVDTDIELTGVRDFCSQNSPILQAEIRVSIAVIDGVRHRHVVKPLRHCTRRFTKERVTQTGCCYTRADMTTRLGLQWVRGDFPRPILKRTSRHDGLDCSCASSPYLCQ